jgi:hypothetical protein
MLVGRVTPERRFVNGRRAEDCPPYPTDPVTSEEEIEIVQQVPEEQ